MKRTRKLDLFGIRPKNEEKQNSKLLSNWDGEYRTDTFKLVKEEGAINFQWDKKFSLELEGNTLFFINLDGEKVGIGNIQGVIHVILSEQLNKAHFDLLNDAGLIYPVDNLKEFLADNNCIPAEDTRLSEGADYDIYEYVDMMLEMNKGIIIDSNSILL